MSIHGRIIRNQPAFRPRPTQFNRCHIFSADGFSAFVPRRILEQLIVEARSGLPNERIGVLVGRPFRDDLGVFTLVSAVIPAQQAKCSPAFVETTLADEMAIAALLEEDFIIAEKVGWYHSHPSGDAHYSPTDYGNQELACPRDYQFGLLVCLHPCGASVQAFWGPDAIRCTRPFVGQNAVAKIAAPTTTRPQAHLGYSIPKRLQDERGFMPPTSALMPFVVIVVIAGLMWLMTNDDDADRQTGENGVTITDLHRQITDIDDRLLEFEVQLDTIATSLEQGGSRTDKRAPTTSGIAGQNVEPTDVLPPSPDGGDDE